MRSLINLLAATLLAVWVSMIAIIAVQNFAPISFRFFGFQSIEVPFGLVLAFSAALGMIGMAIVQPLLGLSGASDDDD